MYWSTYDDSIMTVSPSSCRAGQCDCPEGQTLCTGECIDLTMKAPTAPGMEVQGSDDARLPPEVIQQIVRARYGTLRGCYTTALANDETLRGRVVVRFVIARDGTVASVETTDETTLRDEHALHCMLAAYGDLQFPAPLSGGDITVVYPINFEPKK